MVTYHWDCSKEDLIKHKTEYEYFLKKTDKPTSNQFLNG